MKKGSFAILAAAAACVVFADSAGAMESPIVLAMRYVAYSTPDGLPVISRASAQKVVDQVNQVYSACSIRFELEEFTVASPEEQGLRFHPTSMRELDPIRRSFDEKNRLVVVNTGKWDKTGGLGADGANAWTMMPGERPSGTVIEAPHVANANLVAHELGHYLNLDHSKDRKNLMNPVIYRNSIALDPDQCQGLRQAAFGSRRMAMRSPSLEIAGSPERLPANVESTPVRGPISSRSSLAASAKE